VPLALQFLRLPCEILASKVLKLGAFGAFITPGAPINKNLPLHHCLYDEFLKRIFTEIFVSELVLKLSIL